MELRKVQHATAYNAFLYFFVLFKYEKTINITNRVSVDCHFKLFNLFFIWHAKTVQAPLPSLKKIQLVAHDEKGFNVNAVL